MSSLILYIDDRPELPDGIVELLREARYQLHYTADPEEAMRVVEQSRPVLVLMEIELSSCDGLDLMAGLRDPQFGSVPVLAFTHLQRDSGAHGEAIAAGVADFLTKPVRATELLAAIRETAPAPPTPEELARQEQRRTDQLYDLYGDLSETPMPELLARLRRRGDSGVLAVGHDGIRVGVQFRNGSPIGVASSRRYADQVGEAVLYETFRWPEGHYRFSSDREIEPDVMLELAGDAAGLVLAGVLDTSPSRQVRERLVKRESLYVSFTGESEAALDSEGVGFTRRQRRLLADLGGADTLSVLLESQEFDEKLIYALWVGGWLELRTQPTLTLTELLGGIDEPEMGDEVGYDDAEDSVYEPAQAYAAPDHEPEYDEPEHEYADDEVDLDLEEEHDDELDLDLEGEHDDDGAYEEYAYDDELEQEQAYEEGPELEDDHAYDDGPEIEEGSAYDDGPGAGAQADDSEEEDLEIDVDLEIDEEPEPLAAAAGHESVAAESDDDYELEVEPGDDHAIEHDLEPEPDYESETRPEPVVHAGKRALPKGDAAATPRDPAPEPKRSRSAEIADVPEPKRKRSPEIASVPERRPVRSSRPAPAPRPTPTTPKRPVAPRRPPVDRTLLNQSLRELAERVMAGDDFAVLDISHSATDAEVRAGYEAILAEIPMLSPTGADVALAQRAQRIRDRVEAAYKNLRDEEKRRAYSLLRQEEQQDKKAKPSAERAIEGERWYRKGQGHLEKRRYTEAVEAFGMASHLDPGQGDYTAHLGYALYLSNPNDAIVQREAMEHVATGIKSTPMNQQAYLYLGRILKAKGDIEAAKKIFKKSLRIKRDFHPALQELRVLEMRERKGKGVLSKLLKR